MYHTFVYLSMRFYDYSKSIVTVRGPWRIVDWRNDDLVQTLFFFTVRNRVWPTCPYDWQRLCFDMCTYRVLLINAE